jgi:RNA polymerase sigma-B factor
MTTLDIAPLALPSGEAVTPPEPTATDDPMALTAEQAALFEQHLGLAFDRAAAYSGRWMGFDVVASNALFGLFQAARRFNPARGHAFTAFARSTIDGEIKRGFRDDRMLKNRRYAENYQLIDACWEKLCAENLQEPTDEQLAARSGVSMKTISLWHTRATHQPLDATDSDTGRSVVNNMAHGSVSPEEVVVGRESEAAPLLDAAVRAGILSPREAAVLRLRYLHGREKVASQAEVAAQVGVSQMEVSRIERRVLPKLRQFAVDYELSA